MKRFPPVVLLAVWLAAVPGLPAQVLGAEDAGSSPDSAPRRPYRQLSGRDFAEAIARGRRYLLQSQYLHPGDPLDGAWLPSKDPYQFLIFYKASHHYTIASVTALCLQALQATGGAPADRTRGAVRIVHSFALGRMEDSGSNYLPYALTYGLSLALQGPGGREGLVGSYLAEFERIKGDPSLARYNLEPGASAAPASFQLLTPFEKYPEIAAV